MNRSHAGQKPYHYWTSELIQLLEHSCKGWIARFDTPTTVTTDRGSQFQSTLWKSLMTTLGSHRLCTTSYHPQANGLIERFHHHLTGALKCPVPQYQYFPGFCSVFD